MITDEGPVRNIPSSHRTESALPPPAGHSPVEDSSLIDERRLCVELGISSVTATKWRAKAVGPPFIKVGRLVRYRRSDVETWLRSRTVGSDTR